MRDRGPLVLVAVVAVALAPAVAARATWSGEGDALGRGVRSGSGHRLDHVSAGRDWPGSAGAFSAASREGVVLRLGEPAPRAWPVPGGPLSPRLRDLPRLPQDVDPSLMREEWVLGSFMQGLGIAGIRSADLDADGLPEIVVGHGAAWYALALDPATGRYVQRYFHELETATTFGAGSLVELQVGDPDGDAKLEVVLLRSDGSLEIHDGETGRLESAQTGAAGRPVALELVDLDGGGDELVVLTDTALEVHGFGLPFPLWTVPGTGGTDLSAGDVDGDTATELVVARGAGDGWVVDADLQAVEWTFASGFGTLVDAGDVDGDGMDEIACAQQWGDVFLVDGVSRTRLWGYDNFNTSALSCVDLDGDGIEEILVGDAQWGDVSVRDGADGSLLGSIRNPEHSVSSIDAADVDGDCVTEIVWGAGYSSTGPDRLYVASHETQAIEWENQENDGPMHAFVVADVDADGRTEVVRASDVSDAGYDGALVFVTDLHHFADEHVPSGATNDGWMVTRGMLVGQLDADAPLEYVMNDSVTYTQRVSAFDGVTHERQWTTVGFEGEFTGALALGDPDDDSDLDVLVGTGREHTGAAGTFVRQFDARDGALLWESPSLGGSWEGVRDIRLADVDGDGTTEILAIEAGFGLFVFDGVTHAEERTLPVSDPTSLETADVSGDGVADILIGDGSGDVTALDGATFVELWRSPVAAGAVHALLVADVDGDAVTELLLTAVQAEGSALSILSLADRSEVWRSRALAGSAGLASSLRVADADDDGKTEIGVSTSHSLVFFELSVTDGDALPPVFAGAVGAQVAAPVSSTSCCPSVDVSWEEADDEASPPVEYLVFRDTVSGFVPDAARLVARTGQTSHRDEGVAGGTDYYYVVRAVDAAGNVDANSVEVAIRTADATPPESAIVDRVADVDPCQATGIEVEFSHPGPTDGLRFDLYRDGSLVAADVASPVLDVPGDAASHEYSIVTARRACPVETESEISVGRDDRSQVAAPVIDAIEDLDACAVGGITLRFSHPGFPGAGHLELWVDGLLAESPVSSPLVHVPADGGPRTYVIRAVDDDCPSFADSAPEPFSDGERTLEPADGVTLTLVDACPPGVLELAFTHPGFPGLGHHELWRDGERFLSPAVDGMTFPATDAVEHDYVVRSVDEDCALEADSTAVAFAAELAEGTAPTAVALVDPDPCAESALTLRFQHPGFGAGVGHHELWRDGELYLSSVADGSPVPTTDGLPHSYVVRAVDDDCGTGRDSAAVVATDDRGCADPEDPLIRLRSRITSSIVLTWRPQPDATAANAYVGTLASLLSGRTYDHGKSMAGVTFPESPTPDDGCDVDPGRTSSTQVDGLPDGVDVYVLVALAGRDGVDVSRGTDSGGRDRKDPAVDGRAAAFFCP